MTRFALIGLVLSGCFYTDSINQRPSLDIELLTSPTVYRADQVVLEAVANDPEGDFVSFKWRAYACTDEGGVEYTQNCDHDPFYTELLKKADFHVPIARVDDTSKSVTAVLVMLEGQDDYGATARPVQQLVIGVSDHPPELELRKDSRYGYVIGQPINIFAAVGDPDDGPLDPTLAWEVFTPPSNPGYSLIDFAPQQDEDTSHVTYAKRFTPQGIGDWTVQVTATDSLGTATTKSVMMIVRADAPPCLTQLSPLVAVAPSALPMTESTLFQVAVVTDDLDPYPTVAGDPVLGTATFAWSILPPGAGTRQPLSVTGNRVWLNPANYQPGDIIELRVEVQDRVPRTLGCGDAASCSLSTDSCLQRQTWRVEVR